MTDRVTDYATQVLDKEILAGPIVRDACSRHLRDLKRDDITFDLEIANRAIAYFETVLKLNGGEFEGLPFALLPWQAFIVGSLYGWIGDDGYRRFRVAYIETGKGSGKSPLVAGIGLYSLTSDKEPRAEIYAAAVKKDQAKVLFRDAVAMVQLSPELTDRLRIGGGSDPNNIAYMSQGSFFRPISSEERGRGQSGPRPHCALLDEVHEHPSNTMVEFMRAGTKQRRQALICMITNSGSDKRSPCWQYHQYAEKICRGELEDDGFFGYVCGLDEEDDPFEDENCWVKANPSLPVTPGYKYLREQVREAKGMPSKEGIVRRLNFCQWIEGVNPLFTRETWMQTLHALALEDYRGMQCVAAIDLSGKADLTALALCFDVEGVLHVVLIYWTPIDTAEERSRRDMAPYDQWIREEFIVGVQGKSIDYDWVANQVVQLTEEYDITIRTLAYDRWKMDHLLKAFDEYGIEYHEGDERPRGIELVRFGQGFKDMAPAIDALEERVLNGTIQIADNPVTTMCAANAAVAKDPAENRKFEKSKSTGRIDGMVALAMGVQTATLLVEREPSVYERRGIIGHA